MRFRDKAVTLLGRGLLLGIAFGLLAAAVEFGLSAPGILLRRFGPGPAFLLQTALLEAALGAVLGLLVSPLLRIRLGRLPAESAFLAALSCAWLSLAWLVKFETATGPLLMVIPPAGGLVLVATGLWLRRFGIWLPVALGLSFLALTTAGPQLYVRATAEPRAAQRELPPARPGAPDVVLVVLDTVRAQNLQTYGYTRENAPNFDALAGAGTLFLDATSPSTWSLPSHASLFTGRYPSSHGAHGEHLSLDDRYPTIAQVLAARGYETFCFTSNAWISDGLGLTRGFGWQDGAWKLEAGAARNFKFIYRLLDWLGFGEADKGGGVVASNFAAWASSRPASARPAFVFLNFIEAHFPYHQLPRRYTEEYSDRPFRELQAVSNALMAQQFGGAGRDVADVAPLARDMYDGGVLYTDALLGRVVDAIRERGTLDETILIVLADHGEILGERAGFFGHGPSLYQETLRVPLLVRYPPRIPAAVRVDTPVSTVGAFATILELAGVEAPPTLQVPSLVALAEGAAAGEAGSGARAGPVLSELMKATVLGGEKRDLPDPQMRGDTRYRAYRSGSWKLVETSNGDSFLFDLSEDAGEERDLSIERPADLMRLSSELAALTGELGLPPLSDDQAGGGPVEELDEATQERLRQLGYIE